MIKKTLSLFTIIFTLTLFVFSNPASAVTLKIGVLVPEGTTWAKNLKKMAKEIKKATNKKVKIKIYATPCGSHGGNGYRNGLGKNPKCQIGWEYNSRIRRCVRAFPHQGRRGRFKSPRRR